jgi:hypothetical protein
VVEMGLEPSSLFLVHRTLAPGARTLASGASDVGRASGEYAMLQPRWNQALDAPMLLH